MNSDLIVQIIGVIVLPILAYIIGRMGSIQKELTEHKLHVSETYTKKVDLNDALTKIEKTLENIFNRLNTLPTRRGHDRSDSEGEET